MRAWLFFMNTVYFAVFAPAALAMRFLWFPLLRLFYSGEILTSKIRHSICNAFRFFWYMAGVCRFMKTSLHGTENLASSRGMIIVANHPTYIDYVLLASLMPDVNCLVKAGISHKPALRGIVSNARYLINNEGPELLEEARRCLERGESILIFPEGTRTPHSGEIKLKKGFASLAVRLNCPVLPVTIRCSEHFLDKQMKWYQVPRRMPIFMVNVGEIIEPAAANSDNGTSPFREAAKLRDRVQDIFRAAVCPPGDKT